MVKPVYHECKRTPGLHAGLYSIYKLNEIRTTPHHRHNEIQVAINNVINVICPHKRLSLIV